MEPRFDSRAVKAFFLLLAALLAPAAATLIRVIDAGKRVIESPDPTPLGYTWSLGLFLAPLLLLAGWFWQRKDLDLQKRAFRRTIAVLAPLGFGLDVVFGNVFFTFPNHGAVLGLTVPARGGPIPVEEFVFYLAGFMVCLLLYIWGDEYWVAAYNIPDYRAEAGRTGRIVQFHPLSAMIGGGLVAAAVVYKKFFSDVPEGFPWYLLYLAFASFVPSMGLYRSARRWINWRAFSFTFFLMLLVSLLWEATLGVPYGWWGYRPEAMMGAFVDAWSNLPVEAVCVWLAVTFTTVIFYEVIKIWIASGKGMWRLLLG